MGYTEYSGKEDVEEITSRPLRPDGKIIFKKGDETIIFLIEITVTWMENRYDKLIFKEKKYKDIIQNLKLDNPGSKVVKLSYLSDGRIWWIW